LPALKLTAKQHKKSEDNGMKPIITDAERPVAEYYENLVGLKVEKPRYPTLQTKHLIYARLDDELVNQIIDVLIRTGWNQTDLVKFVFKLHFYMNKRGLFTFFTHIYSEKLLDSDNVEVLKYIRDNLKQFIPDLMTMTAETLNDLHKNSNK
jgi:hypothetical protein